MLIISCLQGVLKQNLLQIDFWNEYLVNLYLKKYNRLILCKDTLNSINFETRFFQT